MSQVITAHDFEEQDITTLIDYLEQRDNYQQKLQQDIKNLWSECFYTTVDVRYCGNTSTTTTTYIPCPWCPLSNFRQLYEKRQELKNFRDDTQRQISQIINDTGVSINAFDYHGKTALNYIQSRDQYNALRNQGADFQVDAFVKMNKYQLIAVAMLAAAWGYVLTSDINVKVEKNKDYLMQIAGISVLIIAIIKLTTLELPLDKDGSIGQDFDKFFRNGSYSR